MATTAAQKLARLGGEALHHSFWIGGVAGGVWGMSYSGYKIATGDSANGSVIDTAVMAPLFGIMAGLFWPASVPFGLGYWYGKRKSAPRVTHYSYDDIERANG
jgi:hypothetical protein